jgi:hypothetical protein
MSGADFDGDTVLVIPNNGNRVQTQAALEGLRNFNPKKDYAAYEGMPRITEANMQGQMGKVSNLITDMTLQKAPATEVVRAIRHSMVVIDSYKHNLDYKRSAQENGIAALKQKYQGSSDAGASSLISRARSTIYQSNALGVLLKVGLLILRLALRLLYLQAESTSIRRAKRYTTSVALKDWLLLTMPIHYHQALLWNGSMPTILML